MRMWSNSFSIFNHNFFFTLDYTSATRFFRISGFKLFSSNYLFSTRIVQSNTGVALIRRNLHNHFSELSFIRLNMPVQSDPSISPCLTASQCERLGWFFSNLIKNWAWVQATNLATDVQERLLSGIWSKKSAISYRTIKSGRGNKHNGHFKRQCVQILTEELGTKKFCCNIDA